MYTCELRRCGPHQARLPDGIESVSKKSHQWLTVRNFQTSEEAVAASKVEGRELWVTHLHAGRSEALCPPLKLPPRMAIVMGGEQQGASAVMLSAATKVVSKLKPCTYILCVHHFTAVAAVSML